MTQRPQHGTHQGSFTRAKVAIKPDDHAGLQTGRKFAAQSLCCGLVGKKARQQGEISGGWHFSLFPATNKMHAMQDMQEKHSTKARTTGLEENIDPAALTGLIQGRARELGFSAVGIAPADVSQAAPGLQRWLALGRHGEMDYMAKHAALRSAPQALLPGTRSVIVASLPYWPQAMGSEQALTDPPRAEISRYALGRDYHKTLRQRLQKLADSIASALQGSGFPFSYRVFSDSAPVMEVELARLAGIGWRGKNTLLLGRAGSWQFLGEIFTNLPLPPDTPTQDHCGSCRRCLDACPTGAIVAPYEIDARRCISYLTIELPGSIPVELRPYIGLRIYGCDDCQSCCPWNRFARAGDPDFAVRHGLDAASLPELFAWTPEDFATRLAGSPIRRIGFERWLRNIAVALGNAPASPQTRAALRCRQDDPSALVREHVAWALQQSA